MITVSAVKWVPPFAQGLVRDLRVRWALEEAGLPYRARLFDVPELKTGDYRALQPFGQVPVLQDGDLTPFESGAILLHIAAQSGALFPADAAGRAQATAWLFAAVNSVEPMLQPFCFLDLFYPGAEWVRQYRPEGTRLAKRRLSDLSTRLGGRDYLEDRFTVGDLMMAMVLRMTRNTNLLDDFPNLTAYRARCEARPAFQRALRAQMADFEAHAPAGENVN
jgi:glutathione S-transferase